MGKADFQVFQDLNTLTCESSMTNRPTISIANILPDQYTIQVPMKVGDHYVAM